jgi:lipopolysaccharide transport system ATP-binding protein
MSNTVIKVENISKLYRLGSFGTNTLRGDLQRWWYQVRGLQDPTLIIGQENSLNKLRTKVQIGDEYVWALKDVSFEVKQGEILGIIGKNGAGKSTLLKLLSRVTAPTLGNIKVKGRIASLLEVGTGFHIELTGRENIFLNGAILGMTKMEVRKKFDEIVEFSGCGRYIDTPVKRYSSGMYVRLAFAVAAHLEPEILIVDEVLAIGDADFQKKAIGKMQDVSRKEGRTVLFVSHNMSAIKSLCYKTVLLDMGSVKCIDLTDSIIQQYLSLVTFDKRYLLFKENDQPGDETCKLVSVRIIKNDNSEADYITLEDKIGIESVFAIKKLVNGVSNINIYAGDGTHVFFSSEDFKNSFYQPGTYKTIMWIPANFLNTNIYSVSVYFTSLIPYKIHYDFQQALCFEVLEDNKKRNIEYYGTILGIIRPKLTWETKRL